MRSVPLCCVAGCFVGFLAGCGGSAGSGAGLLSVTPTITSISPTSSGPNGTITITGTNFTGTLTDVNFSGPMTATVLASSGTATSLTAVVPSQLTAGTYNVSVVDTDAAGDVSSSSNSIAVSML